MNVLFPNQPVTYCPAQIGRAGGERCQRRLAGLHYHQRAPYRLAVQLRAIRVQPDGVDVHAWFEPITPYNRLRRVCGGANDVGARKGFLPCIERLGWDPQPTRDFLCHGEGTSAIATHYADLSDGLHTRDD